MTIQESCQWLEAVLELERRPVGIKFLLDKESFDIFHADEPTNRTSYCIAVRMAGDGRCLKMRREHQACSGGAIALGFTSPDTGGLTGKRRVDNGCFHNLGVSRSISREMTYCAHLPYGIAVMPLEKYQEEPDIVITVCNTYNGMRLVQGYGHHHGFATNMKTVGLQAICHDCTSFPYEMQQLNLSLLCSGTRMLARWGRDEVAIGMPYRLWLGAVDGVKSTVNQYERDGDKKRIQERVQSLGFHDFHIEYGKNYDDGSYVGGSVK